MMVEEDAFDIDRIRNGGSGRPAGPKRTRSVMVDGKMMSGKAVEEYTAKKGLCPICAETKVNNKVKKGIFKKIEDVPLTIPDDRHEGEYLVYKGYCLGALCYTLEQAMRELGEISKHASAQHVAKQLKKKKEELIQEQQQQRRRPANGQILDAEVHYANEKPAAAASVVTGSTSNMTGHRRDNSSSQWSQSTPDNESWHTPNQLGERSPMNTASVTSASNASLPYNPAQANHRRDVSSSSPLRFETPDEPRHMVHFHHRSDGANSSFRGMNDEDVNFVPPTLPNLNIGNTNNDVDNATTSDTSNQSSTGNSNNENWKHPSSRKPNNREEDLARRGRQLSGRSMYSDHSNQSSNDDRSRQSASRKPHGGSDEDIDNSRRRQTTRQKSTTDIVFDPHKSFSSVNHGNTPDNIDQILGASHPQLGISGETNSFGLQQNPIRRPSTGSRPGPDYEIPQSQDRRGSGVSRGSLDGSLPSVTEKTNADIVAISELEKLVAKHDYYHFIHDSLCSNSAKPIVVRRAFQLLRNGVPVAHQATGRYVFQSTPWVKLCLDAMDTNRKNYNVQSEGILMFWSLVSFDTKYMDDVSKSSCIDCTLKLIDDCLLELNNHDEEIGLSIHHACGLVETLTQNEQYGLNVRHPTINKVITAMTNVLNTKDSDVHNNKRVADNGRQAKFLAMRAIYNLSYQEELSDRIHQNICESNAIDSIALVMQNEKVYPEIIEWAVRLLWRLSSSISQLTPEDGAIVRASEDLVDALLIAMNSSTSRTLREASFGLLINLAKDRQGPTLSIVEAIIVTARNEQHILDVQLVCITVLITLCSDKDRCKIVAETDAVSVLVDAMNSHRENAELQIAASTALEYIALNDERSRSLIASRNGVHALVEAFHTFGLDDGVGMSLQPGSVDKVVEGASAALAALSMSPLAIKTIIDLGMLFDLVKYYRRRKSQKMSSYMIILLINIVKYFSQGSGHGETSGNGAVVSMLMKALQNAETAEEAQTLMNAFLSMSLKSPVVLDGILAHDEGKGISHVLDALERFADSVPVQQAGCLFLSNIYIKIPYNGTIDQRSEVKKGSTTVNVTTHSEREIKSLISVMENHKNNESVQISACDALCNFIVGSANPIVSSNVDKASEVVSAYSRCLNNAIDVMTTHGKSVAVQRSALRLLWVLAVLNDAVEMNCWSLQISVKIIDTMRLFREDDEINLGACGVLAVLVRNNEHAQCIGQIEGIKILMQFLQSENKVVVELSCSILATLLKNIFSAGNDFMEIEDSIPNVVFCMMNNSNSPDIQVQCCSVLASVANLHEMSVKALIAANGGLNACMGAIQNHSKNEEVVEQSCAAFSSILPGTDPAIVCDMRIEIGSLLMGVLNNHLGNPEIMQALFATLFGLCDRDDEFKSFIVDSNGIPSIIDAMSRHIRSELCQTKGCCLLWILSTNNANKKRIGSAGTRVIVNAMLAHIDSSALQTEALTALKNLSSEPELKSAIRSQGGVDAIVSSLWVNMRSDTIVCAAFSALNNIAVNSESREVSRIENGELAVICCAMKRFPHEVDVQKCACFLLRTYTFNAYNLTLMKQQEDLFTCLTAAAETFPSECGDRSSFVLSSMF